MIEIKNINLIIIINKIKIHIHSKNEKCKYTIIKIKT